MQLPLQAYASTVLSTGGGGTIALETGGILLLETGGDFLFEGPGTSLSGTGTVSVGPTAPNEQWLAGYRVAVHCATNTSEATCKVYCGAGSSPFTFTDATTWGSTGDSTDNTPNLQSGQQVTANWTGGDPGSEAYLIVTGTKVV